MELRRFYFAHPELVVLPVEHLSERGMSEAFAEALQQERRVSDGWIELFDRAYATYWERAAWLYARAPETWFPPRRQNLALVLEPERTRLQQVARGRLAKPRVDLLPGHLAQPALVALHVTLGDDQ